MTAIGICVEWLISFIEVTMCHYIMRIFFAEQFPKKKQRIIYLCVAVVITTGVILLNLVNLSFSTATVLYFIIINTIAGCILYKGSFLEFLVVVLSFGTGINFLEWGILRFISTVWSPEVVLKIQAGFSLMRILILTITKAIEIAICPLLGIPLKKMAVRLEKAKLVLIGVIAVFISSLYLFGISGIYDLRLYPIQSYLAIGLVFILCFAYLFYRLKMIQSEQVFTARQNLLLQKNYELAQSAYQANAQLYHDMRNHFLLLQNYLAEGKIKEAQDYLEKLSGSKAGGGEHWTGIEAIDYILGQKISSARRHQIKVTINAEYPKDCKIEPVDLCTIITNLLDNAIEGTEKCPEYINKKIDITIRRIHQFILIRITNSTGAPPVLQNGKLITTKKDKQKHGWGVKSVLSAAEKYNGTVKYDYADFMFSVSVMLFYP